MLRILSLCLSVSSSSLLYLVVKMDMYKDDSSPYCYFHPKEEYVGVCPLCLNERLLVLASKQRSSLRTKHSSSSPIISLPKIFALSSLLSRLDLRQRKFHPSSDLDVSTSQEDSFISIKFEDDGNASWEKKAVVSKVSVDNNTNSRRCKKEQSPITSTTSIVEHNSAKSSLRWRKRIGHLFHVIKLRSGSSTSSCHVASSKVDGGGAKVRKQGWMVRTLTRRKTKKSKT